MRKLEKPLEQRIHHQRLKLNRSEESPEEYIGEDMKTTLDLGRTIMRKIHEDGTRNMLLDYAEASPRSKHLQFEIISRHVLCMSAAEHLECFISGLRSDIRHELRSLGPFYVSQAFQLAQQIEAKLKLTESILDLKASFDLFKDSLLQTIQDLREEEPEQEPMLYPDPVEAVSEAVEEDEAEERLSALLDEMRPKERLPALNGSAVVDSPDAPEDSPTLDTEPPDTIPLLSQPPKPPDPSFSTMPPLPYCTPRDYHLHKSPQSPPTLFRDLIPPFFSETIRASNHNSDPVLLRELQNHSPPLDHHSLFTLTSAPLDERESLTTPCTQELLTNFLTKSPSFEPQRTPDGLSVPFNVFYSRYTAINTGSILAEALTDSYVRPMFALIEPVDSKVSQQPHDVKLSSNSQSQPHPKGTIHVLLGITNKVQPLSTRHTVALAGPHASNTRPFNEPASLPRASIAGFSKVNVMQYHPHDFLADRSQWFLHTTICMSYSKVIVVDHVSSPDLLISIKMPLIMQTTVPQLFFIKDPVVSREPQGNATNSDLSALRSQNSRFRINSRFKILDDCFHNFICCLESQSVNSLVQWHGLTPAATSCENWKHWKNSYNLEDKVALDGVDNGTIKTVEVELLGKIWHKSIARLWYCCNSGDDNFYLYHCCVPFFVHPSIIRRHVKFKMLDGEFVASVANFGVPIIVTGASTGPESMFVISEYYSFSTPMKIGKEQPWDPGEYLDLSKAARWSAFKHWDPGKIVQESNYYNLEDKVALHGVGIVMCKPIPAAGFVEREAIGPILALIDEHKSKRAPKQPTIQRLCYLQKNMTHQVLEGNRIVRESSLLDWENNSVSRIVSHALCALIYK